MKLIIKKNLLLLVVGLFIGSAFAIPVSPFIPFFSTIPWFFFLFLSLFLDFLGYFFYRKLIVFYLLFLLSFLSFYFFYSFFVNDFFIFFSEQFSFFGFNIYIYILLAFTVLIDLFIIFGSIFWLSKGLKYFSLFFLIPNLFLFWQLFSLNKIIYTYIDVENVLVSSLEENMGMKVSYLRKSINSSYNSIDIEINNDKERTKDIYCRYTISKYKKDNYLDDHIAFTVGPARYWRKCNWIYKYGKENLITRDLFKNDYIIDIKKDQEDQEDDSNYNRNLSLDKRLKEEIIVKEKGIESCEKLSSLDIINECKYNYLTYQALEKTDIKICTKITNEVNQKKCIEKYIRGIIDRNDCFKINNLDMQNICIDWFELAKSRKLNNVNLCKKIESEDIYTKCKGWFQKR